MKRFSITEIDTFIDSSKLTLGDTLFVHNSFLKFGFPLDIPIAKLAEAFYNRLKKKIGDNGTVAVPTFTYDFCNGIPFNRQESPSKGMGVFSEFIRTHPDSKRSLHPMQSLSVIGKHSAYLTENDSEAAFSQDGPFDRLRHLNTKVVLLGADFNSVSMIHWLEEKYLVPYRYWKSFEGSVIDYGEASTRVYKMYVRALESDPQIKMYSVEKALLKQGLMHQFSIGGGDVKIFTLKDFLSIAEKYIQSNPYFFVSNHSKFELHES